MASTKCGDSYIEFFEGNNCTEDNLGCVTYLEAQWDLLLGGGPIPNDEARSLRLVNVRPGTIKLYNNPDGHGDDWTEIQVKTNIDVYEVGTFNEPQDNTYVKVVPYGARLDGKVSRIDVYPSPA
jgi:hypothetical protein